MKTADVDRVFKKLRMETREGKDKHAWFIHDGKRVLKTKRSHGRGEIKGNIRHLIRQQFKLNEDQFRELLSCPLGREEYIAILTEKGYILS